MYCLSDHFVLNMLKPPWGAQSVGLRCVVEQKGIFSREKQIKVLLVSLLRESKRVKKLLFETKHVTMENSN